MSERFLSAKALATILDTTQTKAAAIMAAQGVYPIDLGIGKYNRRRWLASAVDAAMQEMHRSAQPAPKQPRKPRCPTLTASLSNLSLSEIYQLTTAHNVQ